MSRRCNRAKIKGLICSLQRFKELQGPPCWDLRAVALGDPNNESRKIREGRFAEVPPGKKAALTGAVGREGRGCAPGVPGGKGNRTGDWIGCQRDWGRLRQPADIALPFTSACMLQDFFFFLMFLK